MPEPMSLLMVEFLSWVSSRRRTYAEAMAAWRSSCPRQTVWEDALIAGLIQVESGSALHQCAVTLTPAGRVILDRQPTTPATSIAPVTLQTERLRLRMFQERDLEDYARICSDPEVVRYVGPPFSRSEAWLHMATMLGHWQLRGCGMWAVIDRSSDRLIGRIGFYEPDGWPGCELGWLLARSHWGRGLATEGARAALDFAFRALNKPHVISLIRPENVASIHVAEKLGQRLEGRSQALGVEALVYGIRAENNR